MDCEVYVIYNAALVGKVGLEPTMLESHGFTARCDSNSAHSPIYKQMKSTTDCSGVL